jgi:hypothetical protein
MDKRRSSKIIKARSKIVIFSFLIAQGYESTDFYKNMKKKVYEKCSEIFKANNNTKKRSRESIPEEEKNLSEGEQEKRRKARISKEEIEEIAESREAYRLFYQLKVTIEGTPVWRMVVISGSVTFDNLHKILCIAFGWDEDSYTYSVRKLDRIVDLLNSSSLPPTELLFRREKRKLKEKK